MPIDNSTRFPKPLAADLRELSEGMAIVIDGDTAPKAIASGQYLFIKNHSTLATGGYHATAAIASGADITSSNVTPDADGIVNGAVSALSEHIGSLLVVEEKTMYAGGTGERSANISVAKTGYTAIGIVGYRSVNDIRAAKNLSNLRIDVSQQKAYMYMFDSGSSDWGVTVDVLYLKN